MGGGDKRGGGETKRKKERQGWERDKVGGDSCGFGGLVCWYYSEFQLFLGLAGISLSRFSFCGNPPGSWPVHAVTL